MKSVGQDSLKTRRTLDVAGRTYTYFSLPEAARTLGRAVRQMRETRDNVTGELQEVLDAFRDTESKDGEESGAH